MTLKDRKGEGLFLYIFLLFAVPAIAQVDTANILLDEVSLIEHRNHSAINGTLASGIRIDSKLIQTYPKVFGYTDPIRYLQSLPGVSTNSDKSGGLHVQGGETSHNLLAVSDIPVYGVVNFTGLFSLFNQDHLPKVRFSTSTKSPLLGAELSLDHADTIPHHLSGIASLGIISGQATLSSPFSERTALTLSVRRSFINTMYGNLFEYDGNPLLYGFTDANLTLLHRINLHNTIDINMLWNHNKGGCKSGSFNTDLDCSWGNLLASLRWRHHGKDINSSTSLFATRYQFKGYMNNGVTSVNMPAYMAHYGIKTALLLHHAINIEADANLFNVQPQDPHSPVNQDGTASQPSQTALLGDINVFRHFNLGHHLEITPSILLSAYNERKQYECVNLDPTLTIGYNLFRYGTVTLDCGIKHQYLTQTGISDAGLPTEFWIAAGRYYKPQQSYYATLSYDLQFLQSRYALSVQAYSKRLHNQVEYTGFVMDLLTHPYRLEDNLLIGSGYNYGINLMLAKQAGAVTGWLSYSYGQSLRKGDGKTFPSLFHSSHERSHELNAVMSYKTGRFDLGGNFIMASGCPYTPARNLYLLSNTLVTYYDEYNSARLPMYMRLDLSVTYNLPDRGRLEHCLNFSVFNATAHKNYTLGHIRTDKDAMTIGYRLAVLTIPVIPSISYTCRF